MHNSELKRVAEYLGINVDNACLIIPAEGRFGETRLHAKRNICINHLTMEVMKETGWHYSHIGPGIFGSHGSVVRLASPNIDDDWRVMILREYLMREDKKDHNKPSKTPLANLEGRVADLERRLEEYDNQALPCDGGICNQSERSN